MMKKKLPAVRALTVLSALTALLLVATTFAGCAGAGANSGDVIGSSEAAPSSQEESQASDSPVTEVPAESSEVAAEAFVFIHSDGIDENGFWDGVKALDHVELPEYEGLTIPADVHTVSEEAIQSEVDGLLANYTTENQVTDRAVVDGDTVNIDYVGSVDGVEFEGGNTQGGGTSVTIGVTQYIDDFLEQIIGHSPGETFNVEVTFP
ncbi:MAG: FKBP-type peptidyl-prolyl cis-trans isomerase [Oscillospiraceae bacterium]